MKYIVNIILLLIIINVCVCCPASQIQPTVSSTPYPDELLIHNENWQFTLPTKNWVPNNINNLYYSYYNAETNTVIYFFKKSYPGYFPNNFEDYYRLEMREFYQAGYEVKLISISVINGNRYFMLDLSDEKSEKLIWLTFIGEYGYIFSCSGLKNNSLTNVCDKIISTLQIQ